MESSKFQIIARGSLCGPKYLYGVIKRCDGSCCGMVNGKIYSVLTERLNRLQEAWRRILGNK